MDRNNNDFFESLSPEEQKAYIQMNMDGAPSSTPPRKPFLTTGWPGSIKELFAGFLGLPIETRTRPIQHPFVISSFIILFVAVFMKTSADGLQQSLMTWGFIPSQFYRHWFSTLFTSFFLHGSWLHLLGNSYYFYVFGDDVEDDMPFTHFLKLLFGGHIAGMLVHSILGGSWLIPAVGASAGVSALMGYYMIRFPKRQLTLMVFFFYVWIHVPALAVFLWKFGWEFLVVSSEVGRSTRVAHWAHLGGAAWGAYMASSKLKASKSL